MADNEPLGDWAERRDRHRPRVGERRLAPLGEQPDRGTHVAPGEPRGIQEWDGHQWVPVGVAEDHQAAATETGRDAVTRAQRVPLPPSSKLPPRLAPYRPTEPWYRP